MKLDATEAVIRDLVRLRKRRMIRQHTIAQALGISQSRISQIERMRGSIPLELVAAYARLLGARLLVVPESDVTSS